MVTEKQGQILEFQGWSAQRGWPYAQSLRVETHILGVTYQAYLAKETFCFLHCESYNSGNLQFVK